MNKEHTHNHIIGQLLGDDLFIQWVVNPTPELDSYWQKRIDSDPEVGDNIKVLKKIVDNLRIEDPSLDATQRQEIWSRIEKNTIRRNTTKLFFFKKDRIKIAAAVVAGLIIANISVFLFHNLKKESDEIDYMSILKSSENDFGLTASDVTLLFSGNQQMNVQTDSIEVVYDSAGKLTINAEEVFSKKEKDLEINQLIVPYGKVASVILSDSTKVWVNSGSKLIYLPVFEGNKREVFLKGEAYFEVTKDANRPFIIKTDQLDVTVKGTILNVSAYENEPLQTVVLVSGKVDVSKKDEKTAHNIEPNQLFSYNLSKDETSTRNVDVSEFISWIDGYLLLQSESIDRLLTKLNRLYNMQFHYDKEEMRKIKVSGKLDLRKDFNEVFEYISITAPITYKIEDNEVFVKSIE